MKRLAAKPLVERINQELSSKTKAFVDAYQRRPKLVVILVGSDPASVIYTSKKGQAAERVGMDHQTLQFPDSIKPAELKATLEHLNRDPAVDGILVQRPLPSAFVEQELTQWISPEKDVDGFHPMNVGNLSLGFEGLFSCTPLGVIELLKFYEIPLASKVACVVGRSAIVGKPMAQLLLHENATVLTCHSRTSNLENWTAQADLVVAAAGKPKLLNKSHFKPGSVVIDVGMHRLDSGKLCGDVDPEGLDGHLSALSPVPGGVGPMTIAMLLKNTMKAAISNETGRRT